MRKPLCLAAGLAFLAAAAPAAVLEFSPYAGYTTVNMATVNQGQSNLKTIAEFFCLAALSQPARFHNNTQLTNGLVAGADVTTDALTPWSWLSLGLRGEYLQTNMAKLTLDQVLPPMFGPNPTVIDYELQGTLSSALLGVRAKHAGDWHGLSASLGLYGGLGYAVMNQSAAALRLRDQFTGEGFVAESDLRVDWSPASLSWLRLSAQGGYRYASLGQLYNSRGQALAGPKDILFNNISGGPSFEYGGAGMDVDFSGFTATGGLSLLF